MHFCNWTDFFSYSDSESKLKSKIHHNLYPLNPTAILISLKETVSYSEEETADEQLLPATSTTQFAYLQNEQAKGWV